MNINMKKIAALALTGACLVFTLPSVAANHNYHNQFKSPIAYQQKNDVNDVMEQVAKFDGQLMYIEKELHDMKYMVDERFDKFNEQLSKIFKDVLALKWERS